MTENKSLKVQIEGLQHQVTSQVTGLLINELIICINANSLFSLSLSQASAVSHFDELQKL